MPVCLRWIWYNFIQLTQFTGLKIYIDFFQVLQTNWEKMKFALQCPRRHGFKAFCHDTKYSGAKWYRMVWPPQLVKRYQWESYTLGSDRVRVHNLNLWSFVDIAEITVMIYAHILGQVTNALISIKITLKFKSSSETTVNQLRAKLT